MDAREPLDLRTIAKRQSSRRTFLVRATLGLTGLAVVPLLAACGGGSTEESPTTEPAGDQTGGSTQASPGTGSSESGNEGEPVYGGTLITLGHTDVPGLSPEDAGPTVEWSLVTQIHNGLLEIDENYELESVLAERHEVTEDGLTYTFTLRQGVKFHDGEEFNADDVVYSYEWYRNPENASIEQQSFAGVEAVEATDPYTVVVRMSEPNAAFLIRGATAFIIPEHYHSQVGQDQYRTAPIGTGAFKLKEWRAAEYTVLEAFEDHFRGRPYLDEYRLNVVPEPSVRAIALETGEAHSSVWQLAVEDNQRLEATGEFTVFKAPSVSVNHFPLNHNLPQLAEKEVRQAMMYAIDRQAVIDDVFNGEAVIATSNLAPVLEFWYNPDVKEYPYDPDEARRILDEAGWTVGSDGIREKNGVKLSFTCGVITGDQARRPEAELVQQYLREVGIDMQIREVPDASGSMRRGELDAAVFNWTYGGSGGEPDPSDTLRSDGFNNFSHYRSERMDELIDQGLREVDPEKRREIYNEIQALVAEDVPFLYMMYWQWYTLYSKQVKGLPESALSPTQTYRKAYQFWLDPNA